MKASFSDMLWLPSSPEAFSPVFKIPLLFSGAFLTQLATTPPKPPDTTAEKARYGTKLDVITLVGKIPSIASQVSKAGWFWCTVTDVTVFSRQ